MKTVLYVALAAILLWYVLGGRAWLKLKPWAAGFFAAVEPIEILLYRKSETILWARLKMLVGVVLTVLIYLGSLDLTPIMPFVPQKYHALVQALYNLLPMLITLVGMADEKLRNTSTKPIELVALPDKLVTANPGVAAAVAVADASKAEAVAAAAEAKAA